MKQFSNRSGSQKPPLVLESVSVVIRACQARSERAAKLQEYFKTQSRADTKLYLNRSRPYRGLEFVLYLCSIFDDLRSSVLLLEDDMTFPESAFTDLDELVRAKYPFIQLSVPDKDAIEKYGIHVGSGLYLSMMDSLPYSGAYLISKDFLRRLLARLYFSQDYEGFKFDVGISRAVVDLGQRIVLKPGLFGTALELNSTLGHTASASLDPYFEHKNAILF